MILKVSQSLATIEDLLRNKHFPEALQNLRSIDSSTLHGKEYGIYCILLTEVSLYVGDYSVNCIDHAIEVFRYDSDTDKFARAKFLKGWWLITQGKYFEAREILLEANINYLRCKNLSGAARALNHLSFVSLQLGNIESAIQNLEKCVVIYRELKDRSSESVISMNLAYLVFMAGRLRDSISKYKEIHMDILKEGEKNTLIYYSMSALPHALKGDIAAARKTIEKCKPYLDKYIREKAFYFENLGLISILDGDYKTAEEALKSGLEISLEIAPESALVSQTKRLFGDLYVATNKYGLAEKYAKEALAVAEKINERVEIAACYRVFAQVEQQRGTEPTASQRPGPRRASGGAPSDKAREWYKKAIDLFSLISSRYELAVTRYLAATSGLYYNGERTAMLYLAREYFESEDVAHYVAKIDAKLRKIQLPRTKINKSGQACATIIVVNQKMKKCVELARNVAQSEMTVLLTGVTGTGKDHLARYIHYHSGRTGKFVPLNAAAIQDTMIEAELFGSTRGAFTGSRDRAGLFEEADNGTFYLNEVANASPEFQAKLLEVLETRRVRRLGENRVRRVNFRLIAASNQDLQQRMRDNLFRPDLYHRLNEIRIHLPSLDERQDDTPALVEHFLTFAGFDLTDGGERDMEQLGRILSQRRWPGNVRQLQAEVKRIWAASKGDLRKMLKLAEESKPMSERDELLTVLEQTGWNRREAARLLGVSDTAVRRRIRKFNLSKTPAE